MWQKKILVIIPLILSIGFAPNLAFAYFPGSPHDQQEKGTPIPEITCLADRVLMLGATGKPGCAFQDHVDRLMSFGWTKL